MDIQWKKHKVKKVVKRTVLKSSDPVFLLLKSTPIERYKPPVTIELLPSLKRQKPKKVKEQNEEYAAARARFQLEYTFENSKHLFKKKARRKFRAEMNQVVYTAFVHHIKALHRAYNLQRRRDGLLPQHSSKKKQKKPRRLNYDVYIVSEMWQERKNRYYRKFSRRCAACDGVSHVQLHHMRYGKFGSEPDNWLVPLCDAHHKGFHDRYGTQRNMTRNTLAYIEELRPTFGLPPFEQVPSSYLEL